MHGSDSLHDANGFYYNYYVDDRMKIAAYKKPSDHGAYWRCGVNKPNGSPCGFMLLEQDGVFKEISSAHNHGSPTLKKVIPCADCLNNPQLV